MKEENKLEITNWTQFALYAASIRMTRVHIEYSGGGDSGQVDDVLCFDENDKTMSMDLVDSVCIDYINELFDTHISENIEDWYNNEGGSGEVEIDVKTGRITVENHVNIVETVQYEHEFNGLDF